MSARFAVVTPSYRGDVERCRLLCASIDTFVSGLSTHYLLVEDRDVGMFRPLAGPKRIVVPERDLFPAWLTSLPDPLHLGRRRIWTGPGAIARGLGPLRGWHTQQLRKLAMPRLATEDVLLFADSDVIFLRPYDLAEQVSASGVRLYRLPRAITATMSGHVDWLIRAADTLRIPTPPRPADDYINNLVTWRSDHARAMLDHIEGASGRHWIELTASARGFSEWLLYGLFVDRVIGRSNGHAPTARSLALTYWGAGDVKRAPLTPAGAPLEDDQVAVGVQSFIGVSTEELWALFRAAAREPQPLGR